MPEGPEVKTVAITLSKELTGISFGKLWRSDYQLRAPVSIDALARLEGAIIDAIECHGKMMFAVSEGKTILLFQLGMTGQLIVSDKDAPKKPHTHLCWQLSNGKELRYIDPRRFGLVAPCDDEHRKTLTKKLGPDPFTMNDAIVPIVTASIQSSSRAIKEVILDQSMIAGVGNIYASEALFLAKIHPEIKASSLSKKEIAKLIDAIVHILKEAYKNAGTTFSNYVDGMGNKGNNQAFLKVFKREGKPCVECQSLIQRIKQSGRSTFFCGTCQNH